MLRRFINILSFTLLILNGFNLSGQNGQLHLIPSQIIDPYKLIGDTSNSFIDSVADFEISGFVLFKDYKQYLAAIKIDSSVSFYLSQLPDTNIGPKAVYEKYINSREYDDFPVLGISWDNAMNYCKWKTINENPKDSIGFIFRLPSCSEWLAAYDFFQKYSIKNDMNNYYSDWLINSKSNTYVNSIYFHTSSDPAVLKRKSVIGDSYLYQQDIISNYNRFTFYSFQGYRQISFRIVKEYLDQKNTLSESVIIYWGLKANK